MLVENIWKSGCTRRPLVESGQEYWSWPEAYMSHPAHKKERDILRLFSLLKWYLFMRASPNYSYILVHVLCSLQYTYRAVRLFWIKKLSTAMCSTAYRLLNLPFISPFAHFICLLENGTSTSILLRQIEQETSVSSRKEEYWENIC